MRFRLGGWPEVWTVRTVPLDGDALDGDGRTGEPAAVRGGSYGRLRHAAVATDGALWVLTGSRDAAATPPPTTTACPVPPAVSARRPPRRVTLPEGGRERPCQRRRRWEGSMADVLAAVLLALILLLFAGIVIAFLVLAGWFLYAVVAVARGRRPRTGYGRQLLAAERGRGRRPRRRGRNFSGITIFLDARGPEAPKREP